MNLEQEDFKKLTAIMVWAYEHHIEFTISSESHYDGGRHPVVRFRRNNKNVELALYPFFSVSKLADNQWKEIGMELLVEPPEWLNK